MLQKELYLRIRVLQHLPQFVGKSFNLKNQNNTVPQQRHETYTYNGSNSF